MNTYICLPKTLARQDAPRSVPNQCLKDLLFSLIPQATHSKDLKVLMAENLVKELSIHAVDDAGRVHCRLALAAETNGTAPGEPASQPQQPLEIRELVSTFRGVLKERGLKIKVRVRLSVSNRELPTAVRQAALPALRSTPTPSWVGQPAAELRYSLKKTPVRVTFELAD